MSTGAREDLLNLTAQIVAAHVANNSVGMAELPKLIPAVHRALSAVGDKTGLGARPDPAVPVKKSIMPDYIICLEDGKKLKMLKRYLRSRHGLTPDAYRTKWNLPADYPMVAPNYAQRRSDFAKQIGLGRATPPKK